MKLIANSKNPSSNPLLAILALKTFTEPAFGPENQSTQDM
jgi:hypothetical protein